jgi:hypothetical protein
VIDVFYIDHPATPNTSDRLVIVHTAEEKFAFTKDMVLRNYNVLNRRSYIDGLIDLVAPDAVPKTLEQILNDITGLVTDYNAYTIYPYDVFIQGMDVLSAVDYLCAAHGLLWSYDGTVLTVHDANALDTPDYTGIVDHANNALDPSLNSIAVVFPVLNCCIAEPQQFFNSNTETAGTPGQALTVYYPFFQACLNAVTRSLENSGALAAKRALLATRFRKLDSISDRLTTYEWFNVIDLNFNPSCLRIIYADYGAGPRTILAGKDYPYLQQPYPATLDGQAKNWVGYLTYTYKGDAVTGFWVTPGFAIDGNLPTPYEGDPGIWVINLYKWNYGATAAAIRVEWDCVNYRWIPLQQEYKCPPSGDVDPPTPPGEESPSWGFE